MERYDYLSTVIEDVKNIVVHDYNYIEELRECREDFEEKLNSNLWVNDSVTGNASGSYTFNAWAAEEYLCHNFDLLKEACYEFGCDLTEMIDSPETCDVTIRCYLLNQAISTVLDTLEEELPEEDEE